MKNPIVEKTEQILALPSFYQLIDKVATKHAAFQKMEAYQKSRKKGDPRITANTYDILFAILRSIPATMEDMRKSQQDVFIEAVQQNKYFCFTTNTTLVTMANSTYDYPCIRMSKKTAYNHIQLLLKIGVLVKKANYTIKEGYKNPQPEDEDTRGRGKIKLYIAPDVIHIKWGKKAIADSLPASFFAGKEESLPQYILSKESTIFYNNKETKTIINTPQPVDKKAFAKAKNSPFDIKNTERGCKTQSKENPNKPAENLADFPTKKAKKGQQNKQIVLQAWEQAEKNAERNNAKKLWQFLCNQLYPNQTFNALVPQQSMDLLEQRLREAKLTVDNYRKTKIAEYKRNPAYLAAQNKPLVLKRFQERLPNREKSAFVIVANMIEKQRKHAFKKGYLHTIWQPLYYLSSEACDKAMEYSKKDWLYLTQKYHHKNNASTAYFAVRNWIQEFYYNRVQEAFIQGVEQAKQTARIGYKKWIKELKKEFYLSEEQKRYLVNMFVDLIKTI